MFFIYKTNSIFTFFSASGNIFVFYVFLNILEIPRLSKNRKIDMDIIKEKNYIPYYVGGTIGVLILAGGLYVLKRNKKTSNNTEE